MEDGLSDDSHISTGKTTIYLISFYKIAITGAIMTKLMSTFSEKVQNSYAKAGAFATEAISGIRTVAAFASEPTVGDKYQSHLEVARRFGIQSGFVNGFGTGIMFLVMYLVYAVAFWYGSQLVIQKVITNTLLNCSLLLGNDRRRCYDSIHCNYHCSWGDIACYATIRSIR
jgi:ABC-type bacteriocin/lantibiotic exporter with double-glycine peptidase domain